MLIAKVNANTRASRLASARRGTLAGASATRAEMHHTATRMPAAPETAASTALSVISCRTMRLRLAPIAARMAISRLRAEPLASSRFAILAQAISRISATAPNSR